MSGFADALDAAVRAKKSVAVVGVDPVIERFPPSLREEANDPARLTEVLWSFGKGVIDAVAPHVPAVKPNIAFFEAHGVSGLLAYIRVCAHARQKGLLVIGDIKRGDIGSTAAAYATGHLWAVPATLEDKHALVNPFQLGPHAAVTLNPYLGTDSVEPFLEPMVAQGQGCFILVKTSNPGSAEIQDLLLHEGGTVAEMIARLVHGWGQDCLGDCGLSHVGAVVGATHGRQLADFRELMPQTPFLVPGYGAQGAGADDVVHAFREDGSGALVNASRSVIYAWQKEEAPEDWQLAVARACERMNADLNDALSKAGRDAMLRGA